jgi:hypothetical protein
LPDTDGEKRLRLFVPVYFDRTSAPDGVAAWFKGISLPEWYLPNLVNVARVEDITPFPFLFYAAVPEDLKDFRRGLSIKGESEPYYVRERRALRENLLVNGGFERWNESGPSPELEGFGVPADSILKPETKSIFEGRYAARQAWSGGDAGHSAIRQFRIELAHPRPNTRYEMFVRARNFTGTKIAFHAVELTEDSSGIYVLREVGPYFLLVEPTATFREFHGAFRTVPEQVETLFISAHYYGDESGVSAVWDDFRLVKLEEPTL